MTNVETIAAIYDAFRRGDVPSVLSRLSDDVGWDEWASPGRAQDLLPYLKRRRSREEVGGFFKDVAEALEFHAFEPIGFFESQDHVLARIRFDATVRATVSVSKTRRYTSGGSALREK